jgi:hypothetical protein
VSITCLDSARVKALGYFLQTEPSYINDILHNVITQISKLIQRHSLADLSNTTTSCHTVYLEYTNR